MNITEADILKLWACIEIDFRREYQIDLPKEIDTLSIRSFYILLFGLSPHSLFKLNLEKSKPNALKPEPPALTPAQIVARMG